MGTKFKSNSYSTGFHSILFMILFSVAGVWATRWGCHHVDVTMPDMAGHSRYLQFWGKPKGDDSTNSRE